MMEMIEPVARGDESQPGCATGWIRNGGYRCKLWERERDAQTLPAG